MLFDFIAECVQKFLQYERPELLTMPSSDRLYLGFTFSFPVRQSALAAGTLIHWTKGFDAKHSIGTDVVQMLQLALNRKQLPVACEALVNDTVGTMLSVCCTFSFFVSFKSDLRWRTCFSPLLHLARLPNWNSSYGCHLRHRH